MNPKQLAEFDSSNNLTVFYHGGCTDGITGAFAIFAALHDTVRDRLTALGGLFTEGRSTVDPLEQLAKAGAVFHGISHTDPLSAAELYTDRHVIYVDIAPPIEVAIHVAGSARSLTILDHHRSAKPVIDSLTTLASASPLYKYQAVYTEALSGAQIAWDWAHGGEAAPRPAIVDYVGDRDLYKFLLPNSRAVNKAIFVENHARGFGPLEAWRQNGCEINPQLFVRGTAYLRYEETTVSRISAGARPATVAVRVPGESEPRAYSVLVVNTPILQSEVGEAIMDKAKPETHFAIMWAYVHGRNEIWAACRTNRPDVDLTKIVPYIVGATSGGGLAAAAGFTVLGDSIGAAVKADAVRADAAPAVKADAVKADAVKADGH